MKTSSPSADEYATCAAPSADDLQSISCGCGLWVSIPTTAAVDDLTVLRTPRGEWKYLCLFRAALLEQSSSSSMNQFSTLVMLDTLSEDSSPSSQLPRAQVCPTKNSLRQVPRVCESLVCAPILAYSAQWFDSAVV